ncbi:hypothetical protein [Aeromicrobium piscarium]|uniref:Uncharacterized protein n=1 Tax=Aeromicrobium piscarium TaxID=2590901 RepID=A0A554SP37_9ACTN|nr:hypothetical protein [Aeromicrobium piscarium]TSD68107.1 hypothetical protein FNM00_00485 [Aeromicrobium piscarium]
MAEAWADRHGDLWTLGDDGLLHTPETAPFTREHVEKKWGPLRPTTSDPTGPDDRGYQVVVSAFGLDGAAENRLFDRVANAAHAWDEQVTVHARTSRPVMVSEEQS